jgi:hypothetical protein
MGENRRVNRSIVCLLSAFFILAAALNLSAQGTAFMYQGRLNTNGAPATGPFDFRFALYDAFTNGNAISAPQTNLAVPVVNGIFTTNLDFGAVFTGTNYWLSIGVRTNASTNAFTLLWPRQPLLPVPYAEFANTASNFIGTLSATQLSGALPSAQISGTYQGQVTFTNSGDAYYGTFSGNGSNLTTLNGSQVAYGTVADARLSGNVALLNTNQTFTGANSFTNFGNSFTGSFFGNGLVGWIATNGPSFQAVIDHGYVLTNSVLTTVVLPASANVGDIIRVTGAGAGGWRVLANATQSIIGNFVSYLNSIWFESAGFSGNAVGLAASADGSRMYAVSQTSGSGGGAYYSGDAGHTWTQASGFSGTYNAVACSADGRKAFALGNNVSYIEITTNGGLTWFDVVFTASGLPWTAVACSADGTRVVAAADADFIYYSGNTGATWSKYATTGGSAYHWSSFAWAANGLTVYASLNSTATGGIYASANAGTNWSLISLSPALHWTALAASADGTRIAGTVSPGGIYVSTNSGTSFPITSAPNSLAWQCLAASADCTRIVAGASNGLIYATANLGLNWSPIAGTTNAAWACLAASDDGTKLAAGINTAGGYLNYSAAAAQTTTVTNGFLTGSQGAAVELQYIGNNQFMPVSSTGVLWGN